MSLPTGWEPLPLEISDRAVVDRIVARMMLRWPGYVPREGQFDTALVEEFAQESADTNRRARDAFDAAGALFFMRAFGLVPITGTAGTVQARIVMTGPGATAPAGLLLIGRVGFAADDPAADAAAAPEVAFTLPQAATAGADSTATVTLRARDVGTASNDVPAGRLLLATATQTVISVTALQDSDGGIDPEDRDAFLDRAVPYAAILRPGAVRAADVGPIARSVPGVTRLLAFDLYDADTTQSGVERTASVYPVGSDGLPVSADTRTALAALLESVREVNFRWRIGAPTYTAVQVAVTAVAEPGANLATVSEAIRAAVLAYLDPATWGASTTDPSGWRAAPVVRRLPLSGVVGLTPGVGYLTGLTLNGADADLPLAGKAALPAPPGGSSPTTVTAAVIAPT